ncbi:MAG: hypothetical protein EXS05_23635 [Planctomycetaceae bacterium]|nr:hypothetical protein [Planctomycetaceae bacterium]
MPRIPRMLLIDPSDVGVYHCISRCVRRAFLCGDDRVSGKNFDHRKQWLQDRLQFLAGQFAIDLLGFAVMSNHLHVILRNRADVVCGWSDDDVARRWWNLFPLRRDDEGRPAEPQEWELSTVTGNPERLVEVRARLSSLSWFMRCLAEPIARRANREDDCTGRFWEGRYKCQPILDESAVAACLAYVDLNPIRAQIAETPETSRFTSVYERIAAMQEAAGSEMTSPETVAAEGMGPRKTSCAEHNTETAESQTVEISAPAHSQRGENVDWLSPLELATEPTDQPAPCGRASNTGCLPMPFADYLRLLEWTGRQVRSDKPGAISTDLAPIFERLQMHQEGWLQLVGGFSRLFRRAAGRPASLRREADKWGRRRMPGITNSRAVFG